MTKGPDTHSESFSGLWVPALTSTQTSPTHLLIAGLGLQAGLGVEVTCHWRWARNPANYMFNKRTKYLAYVKNTQNNSKKTPNNSIRKWTRDVNRYCTKVDMQMAKKHIKKQSALLAIRQVQVNTTMWLSLYTYQNKLFLKWQILVRIQRNWNTHIFLVEM